MRSSLLILVILILLGCRGQKSENTIQIKGSDTELNMVQRLAENYMEEHPEVSIAVSGGGSGAGIAAFINGQIDLANASRPLTEEEMERLQEQNIDYKKVIVAVDKIAMIVNPNIQLDSLSAAQIGSIYRGELQNWRELNGQDQPITIYGRQSNSGTYLYFRQEVLKDDYSRELKSMNGNAQIVESVKQDKGGIGYVGIGYVMDENDNPIEGIRVLKIKQGKDAPAMRPTRKLSAEDENYPLSRPLYQYFAAPPKPVLANFIQFELSEKGQKLVNQEGFFPVPQKYDDHNQQLSFTE